VNALLHDALDPCPRGPAIVSKVEAGPDAKDAHYLPAGIAGNLRSLRVEQLAAVNLRLLDEDRADAPFHEQLAAMVAARHEGLIG
jgi:pyridoxine 4-dehydrogenase